MKMSEVGSDVATSEQYQFNYINLESTMSKLRIGEPPSSFMERQRNVESICSATDLMFPDFWRKTLSNPISGHKDAKNLARKKLLNEILRPAKLKFPLVPSSAASDQNGETPNSNLNIENVPASTPVDLRLKGLSSPAAVALPDFSSLSIRNNSKKGNAPIHRTQRTRPRLVRSNKLKNRFSSLKDYRSLRNALPPIPEVDIDDDDQFNPGPGSTDTSLTELQSASASGNVQSIPARQSCSQQALIEASTSASTDDITIDELASYLDVLVHIPKKMSPMAEMMYT